MLEARAAELATRPHSLPPTPEGGSARLTYDQYRSIRFDPAAAIWRNENRNFVLDLLYPGFVFDVPVNINLVVGGTARRVLFKNEIFSYGSSVPQPVAASGNFAGYSGFRVRAPLNAPDYFDEFLIFQGASYFRGAAKGQLFGLSARGLAVRTARPEGEEFPYFTDFWIERPPEQAQQVVIHALLQSPSVVGAYTFTARPGPETIVDVQVKLFPRFELTAFGIAPLTSMFLFDASNRARFDDYRDAVHDSDGLQIMSGRGERLWRALANPRTLKGSYFADENPKGFGLVQRKRQFGDYGDPDAQFDRHPSLWVEPGGEWGAGHVELIEVPSPRRANDNIFAYWQPHTPIPAGQTAEFSYRLRFTAEPLDDSLARVVATRVGQSLSEEGQRSFVIDFKGAGDIPDNLVPEVSSSAGKVFAPQGHVVAQTGAYRVAFELDPEREDLIELRAVLYSNGQPWAETWLYQWSR
ncbi:MAG TPA: glucan biosynthesis protein [Gammaproteobacteria bacterium]|nr:glucan biosynthesis protein [Gammaproteobacteria bacterium]